MHAIDPIQIHRSPTLQADGRHLGPKRRLKDRTKVPAEYHLARQKLMFFAWASALPTTMEKHPIVEVVNEGLRIISITLPIQKF